MIPAGHAPAGQPTPGPWHARRGRDQMCDPNATTIANVGPVAADGARWWIFSPAAEHGDPEATACLIVRAVNCHADLLAALQGMLDHALIGSTKAERMARISAARAALSRATGSQP